MSLKDDLQIETRFKLLSKWNPKKHGERATFDITTNKSPDEPTEEELANLYHAVLRYFKGTPPPVPSPTTHQEAPTEAV